jgi:hypothetical protein
MRSRLTASVRLMVLGKPPGNPEHLVYREPREPLGENRREAAGRRCSSGAVA